MEHHDLFGRTVHYVDIDRKHYPAVVCEVEGERLKETLTLSVITPNGTLTRRTRISFEGEQPGQWHRPEGMQQKKRQPRKQTPEPVTGPGPDHDPED